MRYLERRDDEEGLRNWDLDGPTSTVLGRAVSVQREDRYSATAEAREGPPKTYPVVD
ncbi:MAG TPA: hypothetical protein VKP11_05050 [Frankiaceae bacterium]|nr:hypothetical protein [Frankiaceae bacterium]